jgi:hypothetical protein
MGFVVEQLCFFRCEKIGVTLSRHNEVTPSCRSGSYVGEAGAHVIFRHRPSDVPSHSRLIVFSILALLCLLFAFGVLLYTFVWIAQLLARKAKEADLQKREEAVLEAADPGEVTEEGDEELKRRGGVMQTSATLGLVLAVLACLLVSLGPLVLTLSLAAVYFSAQALWVGLRYFRALIVRAIFGIGLGLGSVGLQYLVLTGQLAQVMPLSAP